MGKIYDSDIGGRAIGRVESNGKVYDSDIGGRAIGRVESNGKVYDSDIGGRAIARSEPPRIQAGGAAYLLIFR